MLSNTVPASFQSSRGNLRHVEPPAARQHPRDFDSAGDCRLCGMDTSWKDARYLTIRASRILFCLDCLRADPLLAH